MDGATSLSTGTFYYITGVQYTDSTVEIFLNGASDGVNNSPTGVMGTTAKNRVSLFEANTSFGNANGVLDEVRFHSDVRTSGWIATDYATQNAPGTFASAATPTSIAGSGAYLFLIGVGRPMQLIDGSGNLGLI